MNDFAFYMVWLGFFVCILLGWFFYIQARTKERMALIEKNADLSEIFKLREFRFPWLKLGIVFMGVGFGFCLSLWLIVSSSLETVGQGGQEMMILGFMLFFGGLGLVIAHFMDKPKAH